MADALRARGLEVLDFAPIEAALSTASERARAADARALERIEVGLQSAQAAYLAQRFDDMIAALVEIEARHLEVLARAANRALLWEVEFQLGLAYYTRAQPGDQDRADARFALALAVDGERRPLRELYGPQVSAAFAAQLGRRAAIPARPVSVEVSPGDAAVVVDGAALIATGGAALTRSLRPGLHVVWAAAPGYAAAAELTSIDTATTVALSLSAHTGEALIPGLAVDWRDGRLRPDAGAARRALAAVARALGASAIVVVAAPEPAAEARAWRLAAEPAGSGSGPVVRASALAAVEAALAGDDVGDMGGLALGADDPGPAARAKPWWRRWWVWAGAGAVVAGAGITAALMADRGGSPRWQISVPPP